MMESAFLTINQWMTGDPALAALGTFLWGMVSVLFSPCHLASIPLIVAYVGGQEAMVHPRQAAFYSAAFTLGLFITIAAIGALCALLGRMLGDVGNYWQVLVGLILIWVALGMMGVQACSTSGSLLYRLNLRGLWGAFALGLAYGILSGSCNLRVHRPDPGHHHHPAEDRHGDSLHCPVRPRPLPAHRRRGQFYGPRPPPHRKSDLAGCGHMVPQRSGSAHRHSRGLLHRKPLLGKLRRHFYKKSEGEPYCRKRHQHTSLKYGGLYVGILL